MSSTTSAPRRRLSSRRGSQSAPDPFALHLETETAQAKASRITILTVRSPPAQSVSHNPSGSIGGNARDRSSWGSIHSGSSTGSLNRGRMSFALRSFAPVNDGKGIENIGGGPPSPGRPYFARSNSNSSLDRSGQPGGRQQHLNPQQVCDLAVNSITHPPPASPPVDGSGPAPTPFHLLSEEHYLPFLDRPAEVTALLASHPTCRLMALLHQTFPPDLRDQHDESSAQNSVPGNPQTFNPDPTKWDYSELTRWLQTVDRDVANDREWVLKSRKCVLARSELIWSRLKNALGVPPELEEEEEEYYDDEEDGIIAYEYDDEREAWLEPIYDGDYLTAKCVASPSVSPETPFGHGMEIIGEGAEEEDNTDKEKDPSVDSAIRAIHGLRLSTPMLENENRSGSVSPVASRYRSLSSAAAPDEAADARRREAIATAVPGRVRRSAQQERGTGDPLFPSSFATLAMSPSLVAK